VEPSYWRKRWEDRRIGWHEGKPNAFLEKYADRLGAPGRVLVPLCGKTEDLAFLASRGQAVVGVDLVETALREFFQEHAIEPEASTDDRYTRLRHEGITLLAGDFFALTKADVGALTAAYDRAAIVALPPEMRVRYVALMRALLPKGARILTLTFDYDQSLLAGPPFSVAEPELRRLYEGANVELLDSAPLKEASGALTPEMGAVEQSWLVTL
jgi:thiopurine S-methyltransferase